MPDETTRYPAAELPLAKAVRGESSNAVEIFARNSAHPQGAWLSVTARPLTDKTGTVRGGVAVFSDMTAHKRAEMEVRQAQKMEAVGRLAGGIAHDFNNILGIVIGQSELLLSQAETARSVRDRIEEIADAASRAASLTRQLLAFSRKQVLQPAVLDLNTVIAEVETMIRRLIGENIEVITVPAHDLESVNADPVQIEQVILNLCVNARDAMPNGGRIIIETKNTKIERPEVSQHGTLEPGRYVQLSVSDTGKGISQEILAHIFEPFFTTKAPEKGTGLGLATVYGIVHQTGGAIRVETQLEQGSTFSVFLPAVQRPRSGVHAVESELALRGSETILLVEDAAPLRSVLRELLEGFGYTVLEAEDGEQARHISEQHRGNIALLLTDLSLPNGSGKAVAKALREKRQGLKVLYMSGYPDNVVSLGIEEDTDFLQKPFGQEALVQKLRSLLGGEKRVSFNSQSLCQGRLSLRIRVAKNPRGRASPVLGVQAGKEIRFSLSIRSRQAQFVQRHDRSACIVRESLIDSVPDSQESAQSGHAFEALMKDARKRGIEKPAVLPRGVRAQTQHTISDKSRSSDRSRINEDALEEGGPA